MAGNGIGFLVGHFLIVVKPGNGHFFVIRVSDKQLGLIGPYQGSMYSKGSYKKKDG